MTPEIDTSHPEFDPEWIQYVFTMTLQCTNGRCDARVACIGDGGVEQDYIEGGNGASGWFDFFSPKSFVPPLKLLRVTSGTPQVIEDALEESFATFFNAPDASLARIRVALEVLLDELGVDSLSDKEKPLRLHSRIEKLPERYLEIKDPAMAVKWLGNEGSHRSHKVRKKHVLEGYEVFSHILNIAYPELQASVSDLVKKINDAKGLPNEQR